MIAVYLKCCLYRKQTIHIYSSPTKQKRSSMTNQQSKKGACKILTIIIIKAKILHG